MSIVRSALSANVVAGLANIRDYIHKDRERLMEERRLRMYTSLNDANDNRNTIDDDNDIDDDNIDDDIENDVDINDDSDDISE